MLRPSPGPQWTTLAPEWPGTSSLLAPSPSPPLGQLSDDEECLPPLFHAVQQRRRTQIRNQSVSAPDRHDDGRLAYPERESRTRSNGEVSAPAILNRERSTEMDEPILEYYDGDVDDVLGFRNSQSQQPSPAPVQIVGWRQNTPSPVAQSPSPRIVDQRHTNAAERRDLANTQGKVNPMPGRDDDVDVIILSSDEEQDTHDRDTNALYYDPKASSSSRKKTKTKTKPKPRSGLRQEVHRRNTVNMVDTSTKATRGKVIYVDPNPIELSDTPDPPPCPRPSRPLPRPLYRARHSPSLSPYESEPPPSQPPPRTPRTPRTPPRTPLFLPTPSPQSPPEQLVRSAPVPTQSRKSAYPSTQTYTPTPAWAPRVTARLVREQAQQRDKPGGSEERKGIQERRKGSERKEGAQANARKRKISASSPDTVTANTIIELSDTDSDRDPTPDCTYDQDLDRDQDSDPDSDFAAFEDIVRLPRKRKRLRLRSPAGSPSSVSVSVRAGAGTGTTSRTSTQTARKTVSMPVKVAKTKEKEKAEAEAFAAQFVESVAQWPSARKSASAAVGLKRKLPVNAGRPRVRHEGWS
ncbi:hypothetical protein EYR40_010355 [Pleurotus pulmonarius]|nr:hypothetical protein EYR40_010355 [Pleurotus pulmonarius]